MYCRLQGYLSPHLIVPIRYQKILQRGKTLCQFFKWHRGACGCLWRGYIGFVPERWQMRSVSVHPEKSIRFTDHAQSWCCILNGYRRVDPNATFKEMAETFNLSESSARRYYYGMHHCNLGYFGRGYNQVRRGACVPI
jgi:hypothetical protein